MKCKCIKLSDISEYEDNDSCKAKYTIMQLQQENQKLKENYDRIYNENCILREKHNINDIGLLDENYKLKQAIDRAIEYLNNVPNITAVVKIPNKPNEELLVGQTLYQKDIIELVKILGRYKGDNK